MGQKKEKKKTATRRNTELQFPPPVNQDIAFNIYLYVCYYIMIPQN